jgi:60 kDa SS-A/Ro ribonucleoprotein
LPAIVPEAQADSRLAILFAAEQLRSVANIHAAANIVRTHRLPREAVPTQWLTHAEMWALPAMPMTALLRNVATLTRVGLLRQGSNATKHVAAQLRDAMRLHKSRVHPLAVLAALNTYRLGRGARGSSTWQPVAAIVDALDDAFYQSFGAVNPSGKRMLLELDVSGSMSTGEVAGIAG